MNRERMLWAPGGPDYRVDEVTVFDARTGLVWERAVAPRLFSHAAAASRCADLMLRGEDDWRLPTLIELLSLVEPTAVDPAIDVLAFPDTPSAPLWTATRFKEYDDAGYVVEFLTGGTGTEGRERDYQVRCVRGGLEVVAGYELSDETVRDTATGLVWNRGESPRLAAFPQARAWCEELVAGGSSDWRLPTFDELASLLVPDRAEPMADPLAFPDTRPEGYWTSTTYAPGAGDTRWAIGFGGEFSGPFELSDPDEFFITGPHARCVR